MENRLKERLTGAAILVALIVLIVPEMFHSQRPPAAAVHPMASGEGPPVRSYTIDLDASGTAAAPMRLSGPPPSSPPPAGQPPASQPPAGGGGEVASLPPTVPAAPAVSSARASGIGGTGSTAAVGRSAVAPKVAAAAPLLAASAGWSVQLGVFAKSANAARLAHAAHNKGFPVHVSRSSRGLYRVALSGLSGRAAAEQASKRLRAAGLPAAIVGPR